MTLIEFLEAELECRETSFKQGGYVIQARMALKQAKQLIGALDFVQNHCQLYGAADAARERIDAALQQAIKR